MSTAYSGVLAELGPRIVEGTLPAGTVLTLEQLRVDFGVSRTIAREVVQVLVSMGLLESRRRTGIRVLPRERWDAFNPAVVRWRLAGAGPRRHLAFLEHDVAFHGLLLAASGNVMFAALGDVVEEVLRGRTGHHLMPSEPKPEARRLHLTVARAVARGESEAARAAMSRSGTAP